LKGVNSTEFVAGQLKLHSDQWSKLTTDGYILSTVTGYKIEWINEPPYQTVAPYQNLMSLNEQQAIDDEIVRLLGKKVLVESKHEEGEFISTIFTRPKRTGGFRMILNLSKLNDYVEYHHFKMDTLESVMKLVDPDCYMASIDLKDAYYSVPIHRDDQKYLKFKWKGVLYQFTALPNGLSSGPRIFTKLLKVPFSHLRKQGHIVTGYIDDTLIIGQSTDQTVAAVNETVRILSDLGFVIHQEKSVFKPTKEITYLGCVLNSENMTSKITHDRQDELVELGNKILNAKAPSIQEVSSVVGKIVAAFSGAQYGKLHYRELEKSKTFSLAQNKGNYHAPMKLTEKAKN